MPEASLTHPLSKADLPMRSARRETVAGLIAGLFRHRAMILTMAVREFRVRFAGTIGGFAWSVISPLMMVLIYWFIFSVGLRVQPVGDVPFVVVFVCGLLPWTMFAESLTASAGAVTGNAHLVTKTVFPTEILPAIPLAVSFLTHAVMSVLAVVLLLANGFPVTVYWIQTAYYFAAMIVLSLGLNWLCAALNVFFRDMREFLGVALNLWFWMTPIVWPMEIIPDHLVFWMKLNPMYYIVEGYRASLIYGRPFWHEPLVTVYFWSIALVVFFGGAALFKTMKPEFAEVL